MSQRLEKFEIAQAPASAPQAPLDELLARAKSLSSSGKLLDAYELLAGEEDAYIGTIEFDYALGRTALEARRPDKATLAFSRVLALDPNHAGALIDIGRAYLALGNFDQARATFETLLGLDPPPDVRVQLQAYLEQARLARLAPPSGPGLSPRGYLAAIWGRSTNVNQSPGQPQVFVPAFGATFELSNQNIKKADSFSGVMGGIEGSLPLNNTYSLVGGGDFSERRNNHESSFNLAGLSGRLGVVAASEAQLLRVQMHTGRDYLGGSPSRYTNALGLDYLRSLGSKNGSNPGANTGSNTQFLAFTQMGRLRHLSQGLRIFDADFVILGMGASHKFVGESTVFATISTGHQNDIGGNPSGDRRQLGLRVGADAAILPGLRLMGNIAWERGQYDRFDTAFLTERRDLRTGYEMTLQYALSQRTFLRFGLTQTDQRSNISIYEYDRKEHSIMLRYEFP